MVWMSCLPELTWQEQRAWRVRIQLRLWWPEAPSWASSDPSVPSSVPSWRGSSSDPSVPSSAPSWRGSSSGPSVPSSDSSWTWDSSSDPSVPSSDSSWTWDSSSDPSVPSSDSSWTWDLSSAPCPFGRERQGLPTERRLMRVYVCSL